MRWHFGLSKKLCSPKHPQQGAVCGYANEDEHSVLVQYEAIFVVYLNYDNAACKVYLEILQATCVKSMYYTLACVHVMYYVRGGCA